MDSKSHVDNEMADGYHKAAFPTVEDLKGFLQEHWPKASDLSRVTDLSPNTVANWYRSPPREMSAPNFLQALIQTGKLDAFEKWLRRGTSARRPSAPPLPGTAIRRVAEPTVSDEIKRGTR